MKRLGKEHILILHRDLIESSGGLDGLRDEGLLESALEAPFQSFSGTEAFPSIQRKAARLGYGLIKNHPFVDGNKRVGTHSMLTFLALNGIELQYTQKELINIILGVASDSVAFEEMVVWIIDHQT